MKILVTGATGFIGSHLVKELCEHGYQCRCLVRDFQMARKLFKDYNDIEYVVGDVTESRTLKNIGERADVVIHLAALLGDFSNRSVDIWNVNVNGTKNLLQHVNCIKQFIFCSTPGVHGFGHRNAHEDLPYNSRGIYERSKVEAEKVVMQWCAQKRIKWSILRPDFVYGPGDLRRLPLYKRIAAGKMYIIGDGKVYISPTYIADVIQGFLKSIDNENAFNGVFNISGESLTVESYLNTIARMFNTSLPEISIPLFVSYSAATLCEFVFGSILKKEPPITKNKVRFLTQDHTTDNQKARDLLDFIPKYSFEQGMRKTIDWYNKEKLI